jgi:AcrR family transcriptional regulator
MSTKLSRRDSQARTRDLLVQAAAGAFRRHGFHRATAEQIAAEAGFTRGALYANFDGKEGLFLAVLDDEIKNRQGVLGPPADPVSLAKRYQKLLDSDPGWTLALLEFTIHAARHPQLASELIQRNLQVRSAIAQLIAAARPGIDPNAADAGAKLVIATNTGVSLERALDHEAAGHADLARAYAAALGETSARERQ